jgi:hypothetical protein
MLGDGHYLDSMELSRIRHMFALLGQAGDLDYARNVLARSDQASAAHPARTHQGFERVGVTENPSGLIWLA